MSENAYIANLLPFPQSMTRSYGTVYCPPCPEGQDFLVLEIKSRTEDKDMGDNRRERTLIPAADIAVDFCRNANGDAGPDSFLGVIVCGPDGPTAKELA